MVKDSYSADGRSFTEKIEVAGEQLVNTVKGLFEDSSAKRVTIRTQDGKKLLSIPLTVGVVGGVLAVAMAPLLSVLAAVGGAAAKLRLEIDRKY